MFLYVFPAIVFLVPVSLVAAELASGWQGGVYNWVGQGVSEPMGLVIGVAPPFLMDRFRRPAWKMARPDATTKPDPQT